MRIQEIISEAKVSRLVTPDNYGGFIKIEPNPDVDPSPAKFSIAYINENMAIFYKVNPRIIGYDSHGHVGIPEPHLHGFSKTKNSGIISLRNNDSLELPYRENIKLFYRMYFALIRMYKRDIKNAKQKSN